MACYNVQENRYKGTNWKFTLPENAPMTEVKLPSIIVDFVQEQVSKDGDGEESTVSQELTNLIIEQKFDGGISGISTGSEKTGTKLASESPAYEPIQKRLLRWFARPKGSTSKTTQFNNLIELCNQIDKAEELKDELEEKLENDPKNKELQKEYEDAKSTYKDLKEQRRTFK